MKIGDVLIAQGLVTQADVEAALALQNSQGGILGEHLIAMGKLDPADLERVMRSSPPSPRNIEETGLGLQDLLNLVAKAMYSGAEMPSVIGGILKAAAARRAARSSTRRKSERCSTCSARPAPSPRRSCATL